MAQRLVRRIDPDARQLYKPGEKEIEALKKIIDTLPEIYPNLILTIFSYTNQHLPLNNPYGYKGQIAIREQFLMSDKIRAVLEDNETVVTTSGIAQAAIRRAV